METDEFTKYNTTNVSTSNHTGKEWVLVHEYCLCRVCKHVPSAFPMLYQVSVQENTQQVPAWPAHARGENDVSRCLMCCICSLLCDFTRHRLFSSVRNLVIQHPTPAMRDFQPMAALQKNRWQIKRTRRQPSPEPPLMCESMGEGTHQLLKQWFLLYIGRFQTAPFKQALYIYIYQTYVSKKSWLWCLHLKNGRHMTTSIISAHLKNAWVVGSGAIHDCSKHEVPIALSPLASGRRDPPVIRKNIIPKELDEKLWCSGRKGWAWQFFLPLKKNRYSLCMSLPFFWWGGGEYINNPYHPEKPEQFLLIQGVWDG